MSVPDHDQVREVVEHELDTRVVSVERQARWRPTWFVDTEKGGNITRVVVRGDRIDAGVMPLRHEHTFHRLLEENGIKVPRLHAFTAIGDLDAVIMEFVPGKPSFGDLVAEDRDTVVDEYVQQMARIHSLDPVTFVAAGIKQSESTLAARHRQRVERWRSSKMGPHPFAEFAIGWLDRHQPDYDPKLSPCLIDTGQFHHRDGHLEAILDLEFGQIEDPLMDLASWRMRDTLIPFGEMENLYARYENLTGSRVDRSIIKWYHFAGAVGNGLMFRPAVKAPKPDSDIMTYLQWSSETDLMATDFLCEEFGIDEPLEEVPPSSEGPDDVVFSHLSAQLGRIRIEDTEARHSARLCFRMARHLERINQIGTALRARNIEDIAEVLARRPADLTNPESELEQFVISDAAKGRHDLALARLFHRMHQRTHMMLGPSGSSMVRHYQCQRFDGRPARTIQF